MNQKYSNTILFNQSKDEEFTLLSGFRQLHKHIRNNWLVDVNRDEELSAEIFEKCHIFVLPSPKAKFTDAEFSALREFLHSGGSLFVLSEDGGPQQNGTNLNSLLEEYGIAFNSDSVIRVNLYNYFHPKEAFIPNGILNRAIPGIQEVGNSVDKQQGRRFKSNKFLTILEQYDDEDVENNANCSSLGFVYPHGCTLDVISKSSVCVLSTGTVCFPFLRPICAFHQVDEGGRIVAIGSVQMFTDDYFVKEDNSKIFDAILKFLSDGFELNRIDAMEPEIADAYPIPDNIQLANQMKTCLDLSELEQMSSIGDFTKLFDHSLCTITMDKWPEAIRLYDKIGLKHGPLTLVSPAFQVPLPSLQPATFQPEFRELVPPQLELFDLDDAFTSFEVRLAQLTNRCAEDELELYIREAAQILGINRELLPNLNGNNVMEYATMRLFEWKNSFAGSDGNDDLPDNSPNENGMFKKDEIMEDDEATFSNIIF